MKLALGIYVSFHTWGMCVPSHLSKLPKLFHMDTHHLVVPQSCLARRGTSGVSPVQAKALFPVLAAVIRHPSIHHLR